MFRFMRRKAADDAAGSAAKTQHEFAADSVSDGEVRDWCRTMFEREGATEHSALLHKVSQVITHRRDHTLPFPLDADSVESVLSALYLHRDNALVARRATEVLLQALHDPPSANSAVKVPAPVLDVIMQSVMSDPDMVLVGLAVAPTPDAPAATDTFWARHAALELLERLTIINPTAMMDAMRRTRHIASLCSALAPDNGARDETLEHRALQAVHVVAMAHEKAEIAADDADDNNASPSKRRVVRGELAMRLAFEGGVEALISFVERRGGFRYPSHTTTVTDDAAENAATADDIAIAAETLHALVSGHSQIVKFLVEMRLVVRLTCLLPHVGFPGVTPGSLRSAMMEATSDARWLTTLDLGLRLAAECLSCATRVDPTRPNPAIQLQLTHLATNSTLLQCAVFCFSEVATMPCDSSHALSALILMGVVAPVLPRVPLPSISPSVGDAAVQCLAGACHYVLDAGNKTRSPTWSTTPRWAILPSIFAAVNALLANRSSADGSTPIEETEAPGLLSTALMKLSQRLVRVTEGTGSELPAQQTLSSMLAVAKTLCGRFAAVKPLIEASAAEVWTLFHDSAAVSVATTNATRVLQAPCCHEAAAYRAVAVLLNMCHVLCTVISLAAPSRASALRKAFATRCGEVATTVMSLLKSHDLDRLCVCENRIVLGSLLCSTCTALGWSAMPQDDAQHYLPALQQWRDACATALSKVTPAERRRWEAALRMATLGFSHEQSSRLDHAASRAARDEPIENPLCSLRRWHDDLATPVHEGSTLVVDWAQGAPFACLQPDSTLGNNLANAICGLRAALSGLTPFEFDSTAGVDESLIVTWFDSAISQVSQLARDAELRKSRDVVEAQSSLLSMEAQLALALQRIQELEAELAREKALRAHERDEHRVGYEALRGSFEVLAARDRRARRLFELVDPTIRSSHESPELPRS